MIEFLTKHPANPYLEDRCLSEPSEAPLFPKQILLDLSSICNQACVFCANPKMKNKKTMKSGQWRNLLEEAYSFGARRVGVFGTGEPFTNKELADCIGYAKSLGYEYTFIKSNGSLSGAERGEPVLAAGLDSLRFSIHASNAESYKKVHKRNHFAKVLTNIKILKSLIDQKNYPTALSVTLVLTGIINDSEVEELKEVVGPYIDAWEVHKLTTQCGNLIENNEIGNVEAAAPLAYTGETMCAQPFSSFTITPEGYVSACNMDFTQDLIVGDSNQYSLKEIWNSKLYTSFRNRHIQNNLRNTLCFNCVNNCKSSYKPLKNISIDVKSHDSLIERDTSVNV